MNTRPAPDDGDHDDGGCEAKTCHHAKFHTPSSTVRASSAQVKNMAIYLTHLGRHRLGLARVELDRRLGIELRQSKLRLAKFLLKTASRRRSIVSGCAAA